jgi:hypothetical protein
MIYQSVKPNVDACLRQFKNTAYWTFAVFVAIIPLFVVSNFYAIHSPVFTVIYCLACTYLLYNFFVTGFIRGADTINKMIDNIEITGSQVILQTMGVSMLFNWIRRSPVNISINRSEIRFLESTAKVAFKKDLTGQIFLLIYAGEEYWLVENFFEDFQGIKYTLEQPDPRNSEIN